MKKLSIFLSLSFLICQSLILAEINPALKEMYRQRRYFDLRDTLSDFAGRQSHDLLFFRGAVANKFNRPAEAEKYLTEFLNAAKDLPAKEILPEKEIVRDAYEMLADSYVKSRLYGKAAQTYGEMLNRFHAELDSEKVSELRNSLRLWKSFEGLSPQEIISDGETRLKMTRDKARLTNLAVKINGEETDFIFDTGAGISSITESCAEKLGLKIVGDSIEVGAVTGNKVMASLGVAPPIKIGNLTVRNAIFLVFSDTDLSVPQIDYQINGIIGFPVIEAMGDITITRSDSIIISESSMQNNFHNLCLEELTPIVAGIFNGRRLSFSFDTGARTTMLYHTFFRDYENMVKSEGYAHTHEVAGAGGSRKLEGYKINEFRFQIAGRDILLNDISIISNPIDTNSSMLYGNLGQDVIRQFEKMTMNFRTMSLSFE